MPILLVPFNVVLYTLHSTRKQVKEEKVIKIGKVGTKLSLFSQNRIVKESVTKTLQTTY